MMAAAGIDEDVLAKADAQLEQAEAALDEIAEIAAAAASGSRGEKTIAGIGAVAVICGSAPVPPSVVPALLLVSELLTARAQRPRAWSEHSRRDAYAALAYACVRAWRRQALAVSVSRFGDSM